MDSVHQIKAYARELNLTSLAAQIGPLLEEALRMEPSYSDFSLTLLEKEIQGRHSANLARRIRAARLPLSHDLDKYDHSFANGISPVQMRQLRELLWLDQKFNLMLTGPSGTGKTFITAGLCFEALKKGYRCLFRSMDQLAHTIKMKGMTTLAAREYKRLLKTDLLVIDDIMMFPLDKETAVGLFQLVNQLHESASFIITTNKKPKQWAEMLEDEVLATALLDRLLYKCEILKLTGKSYRLENRKTIFNDVVQSSSG